MKELAALQLECGNDAEYFQADLSNSESRDDLAKFAQQIGGATLLINNAGVNVMQGFSEISEQQIDHLLNINLHVPIKLCQLFLPQVTRNKGTIVNIGSSFGSIGYPYQTLYRKLWQRDDQALARELSHSDVKVLCLLVPPIPRLIRRKYAR